LNDVQLSRSSLSAIELPVYPGIALADVTLVASDAQADAALMALMATDVIGFDTEVSGMEGNSGAAGFCRLCSADSDSRFRLRSCRR